MKTKRRSNQKKFTGFSDFERRAMQERARELLAESRASRNRAEGRRLVMAAIAKLPSADRVMAKKIHALVTANAPKLVPKTWYGMPAYANQNGKVVLFFQSGHKYQSRYCTLGFTDAAKLDEGVMWPAGFALKKITAVEARQISALIKKSVR